MKKLLSIILAALMVISFSACSGSGTDDEVEIPEANKNIFEDAASGDKFTYEVNEKGGYDITGFIAKNSTPHKVEIPASILDVEVSGIASRAFVANSAISEIVIPESVLTIKEYAFYGCMYLTDVTMTDAVTVIGKGAFEACSALDNIKLSAAIEKIPEFAFRGCSSLASIELPTALKKIENGAFFACASLEQVTIPTGVESLGDGAFYGNVALTSATVPSSVETFGKIVFHGASEGFALVGLEGSAAQDYAEENGYEFMVASAS